MKSFLPIASVFLATLVLIGSIGVTINMHVCAGKVQSVALFGKAKPCKPCGGMEHHSKKNGCCEEESIVLKGKETTAEVNAATQFTPSFSLITVILPVLYSVLPVDSFVSTPRYAHYKPPLLEHDITVFVQSFLI